MELIKYTGGSDAREHTSVLAAGPAVGFDWYIDRSAEPDRAGTLLVGLPGVPRKRGEPDQYGLRVSAAEVGAMLAAARPADIKVVMAAFLGRADPEVLGVAVGEVVAHLARGRAARPDAANT